MNNIFLKKLQRFFLSSNKWMNESEVWKELCPSKEKCEQNERTNKKVVNIILNYRLLHTGMGMKEEKHYYTNWAYYYTPKTSVMNIRFTKWIHCTSLNCLFLIIITIIIIIHVTKCERDQMELSFDYYYYDYYYYCFIKLICFVALSLNSFIQKKIYMICKRFGGTKVKKTTYTKELLKY